MRNIFILTSVVLAACSSNSNIVNVRLAQTQKSGFPSDAAAEANFQGSHYIRGKWHLAAGNIALALDSFRKELRENPNSINARNGLAVAYDRLGRFDLSRRYYEEALALQPDNKIILSNLGYSLVIQGKKQEAETVLAAAEKSLPATPVDQVAAMPVDQVSTAPVEKTTAAPVETITAAPVDPIIRNNKIMASNLPEPPQQFSRVEFDSKIQKHPDQWLERTSPHTVQLITLATNATPRPWLTDVTREKKTPSVLVLNAARKQGIAARFKADISRQGWVNGGIGDSISRSAKSKLFYDPALHQDALKLAWSLSFLPVMQPKPGVKGLVLYIGRDAIGLDHRLHLRDA
jgi:tetratricopeptide (TPR) repeat protein